MGSKLSLKEAYPRGRLWAVRFVGTLVVLGIVAIGVRIDASNPPLTSDGPFLGALGGGFIGAAVSSWLLRYVKPSNVEIEVEGGEAFGTAVLAVIGTVLLYIPVGLVIFILASLLTRGALSGIFPFAYPGEDVIAVLAMITSALLMTAVMPEWSLNTDDDVTIKRKVSVEEQVSETLRAHQRTKKLIKASGEALREHKFETAEEKVSEADTLLEDAENTDEFDDIERLREDLDELRQRLQNKVREEVQRLTARAETKYEESLTHIEAGEYEKANARATDGSQQYREAADLVQQHNIQYSDSLGNVREALSSLNERIETIEATVEEINEQKTAVRRAIQSGDYDRAKEALRHFQDQVSQLEEFDEAEATVLSFRAEAENFSQEIATGASKRINGFFGAAESSQSQAKKLLDEQAYGQAEKRLESALESLKQAEEINDRHGLERDNSIAKKEEEISALLKTASNKSEEIEEITDRVKEQQESVRRAIRSGEYDRAEEALRYFRENISQLEEFGEAESTVSAFKSKSEDLEREITTNRASRRVGGFLGAARSSRSQAEKLLDKQAYDQAERRLESALESLEQAEELSERHGLGREETIAERKGAIRSLLESVSSKPSEKLSTVLQEAESEIASGIDARDVDDLTAAVESFETGLSRYEEAAELVSEYELDQQWEVQQRYSMVEEYLEVTQEALDDRRSVVRGELEEILEDAESVLLRAEQHVEVDDFVSAREDLSEVRGYIDGAAQLLETGFATEQLNDRYTKISQQEKELREQLPDKKSEGHRTSDLVESLQVLATKLDGSPPPEFVNRYGDYPADAYLDTFGSWPEALAAANLDPVDEESRERGMYSRVEVLDAVVELANKLGHPPSKTDMNNRGAMSASPVESRFKDWETALEVAGITDGLESGADEDGAREVVGDSTTQSGERLDDRSNDDSDTSTDSPSPDSESDRREAMLELVRGLYQELGRVPKTTEIPEDCENSPYDFYNEFGSWDETLEAAGIDKEQELLDDIERVAEKLGRVPTSTDMDEYGIYSGSNYSSYFDSWSAALEKTDLEENREESLLETLQSLHERLGRLPKSTDLHDVSGVSQHDYIREFGSWDEALEAAGIDKQQYLIDDLQRVATEIGSKPGTTEVDQIGEYSSRMHQKYFGSWDAAMAAADLSSRETTTGRRQESEDNSTGEVTLDASTSIEDIASHIDGLGPQTTLELKRAGYTDLEDLCNTEAKEVAKHKGIGRTKARRLIQFATETVSSNSDESRESPNHGQSTDRSLSSGSETNPSGIPPETLTTSWETIPDNERIDHQFLIQVMDIDTRVGERKTAQLNVRDRNGREFGMNIWSKHDVDQEWRKGGWYILEHARGKVWESKDGTIRKKISSTKDLTVVEVGEDFDLGSVSIDEVSKTTLETDQSGTTTEDAVSEGTIGSTTSDQNSAGTTDEKKSREDNDSETSDDGVLDEIMSDFDEI